MSLSLSRPSLEGLPEDLIWAISAAAGPRIQAADAWARLMGTMEFLDISASVQRLTPQIFLNLRDETGVPSRERLRGAYRYTWTKNGHLWSLAQGLFEGLRSRGVDYRLLKGAALHAYTGSLGSRSIGDFDLLVHSRDVQAAVAALGTAGFRQEGSHQIDCGHAVSSYTAINFNRGKCHVDLHVAPIKEPSALLSQVLASAPLPRRVGGLAVQIPSPIHLLLHAAWHASEQYSETDLAQGLVDVALLAQTVSLSEVSREAATTGQEHAVQLCRSLLDAAGLNTGLPSVRSSSTFRVSARRVPRTLVSHLPEPPQIAKFKSRKVTGIPWRSEGDSIRGRGVAYCIWLRLGHPGKLEPVLSGARGFLQEPGGVTELPALIHPFDGADPNLVATSPWSDKSLDWRFRVRVPQDVSRVRVIVGGKGIEERDAALFVNAAFQGRLVAGDESLREVHCSVRQGALEISIRPVWAACPGCFPPLKDLTVTLEDISPAAPSS